MKKLIYVLSFILFSCESAEDTIVVLPIDYTGYVVVLYGQEDGEIPKYMGEKRVYEIPENGILKTQFQINSGWSGFPDFYYGEITKENQIPFIIDPHNIPQDKVVAFGGSSGVAYKNEGKEEVRFVQFYVGNEQQIDQAYEAVEKLDIISLTE